MNLLYIIYLKMAIKIQLENFYIALGHQYVSENVIKIGDDFLAIFWRKAWAIVQGFFPKFGVVIAEVGIDSNLLHSISTSICIRKCNKNFG